MKQAPCSQENPTELTSFSHEDVNSDIQPTLHRQADHGPSNGPKAGDKLHHCQDSFSTSKHLSQSWWSQCPMPDSHHCCQGTVSPGTPLAAHVFMGHSNTKTSLSDSSKPEMDDLNQVLQSLIVLFHRDFVLYGKNLWKTDVYFWVKHAYIMPDGVQKMICLASPDIVRLPPKYFPAPRVKPLSKIKQSQQLGFLV